MKLAKKFLSVAAVLAMGTCVYTVPVFAEDQNVPPLTGVEETAEDPAPIAEDPANTPAPVAEEEDATVDYTASKYVKYGDQSISFDAETKKLTVTMEILQQLPVDLIYELSWPKDAEYKLVLTGAAYNGKDLASLPETEDLNTPAEEKPAPDQGTTTPGDGTTTPGQGTTPPAAQETGEGVLFENEAESTDNVQGFRTIITSDQAKYSTGTKNELTLTFELKTAIADKPSTRLFKMNSKVYLKGHAGEKEVTSLDSTLSLGDIEQYAYTSAYDETANTFTLNVAIPEAVYSADNDLFMMIGTTPDASVLESIRSVKIGGQLISEDVFKTFVKEGLKIPGLDKVNLPTSVSNTYLLDIPYSYLNRNMNLENDEISIVFNTAKNPSNATAYAYTSTKGLLGNQFYTVTLKNEAAYNITGVYNADLNTWTVGVQPAASSLADANAETTITITSNPNVMTKLDSLVIGSKEVLKDVTGNSSDKTTQSSEDSSTASSTTSSEDSSTASSEDSTQPSSSNEAGEDPVATLTTITNGYQIKVKNADLQGLKDSDWIKAQFSVEKNFDTSKMEVTAESGTYKSETYEKEIKAEVGDTNNATFKGSHDYDSSKQTWTVNLAMTGRPDKLDLTFTQTEGTALGKPTSITVDGKAVAPTVNTKMSGSTMSECTVDFRKEDLDLIKADSKVTLVFPIDGSKEQSERILMNVDLGSSSKDLSAKFTVKKSTGTPSSSSNVNTATETNMNTIIIVMVVALAAFAIFGVLAFKKKKTK